MHDALRHRETLPRPELDRPPLEIDDPSSLDHVEELVLVVVLVPVEFTLHHAEAHDAVVHATERLVVPAVPAAIDELERSEQRVEMDGVGLRSHRGPPSDARA